MQSIGGVILAAGRSSRFGSPKQLAQFRGKSLVQRVVDVVQQAGCSPVVVVAGHNAAKVSSEATTSVVENKNWRDGIGSSIRVGVEYLTALEPDVSAIVLLVCDQPLLDAEVIINLKAVHQKSGKEIVASSYADTLGVPALFARCVFPELLALSGDRGAKKVILANRDRVAEFPFPGGNLDIDTPADYKNLTRES
jgi:molybdenum cofactor cytidylyltransferase